MAKVDNALSETFGVPTLQEVNPATISQADPPKSELEDFEFVRLKLHALLHAGTESFETLALLAKTEEKISAFQALNEMMGNLSDISLKLLEIQEKKQKLTSKTEKHDGSVTNVTNNVAYIGSTADLAKLLNDHNFLGDTIDNE